MRRLRQMQTRGGYPGRGGPQMPRGANGALIGGVLLATGAWVLSNSLFNVDGGHRAIKYQRLQGVSKEIYAEGKLLETIRFTRQLSMFQRRKADHGALL